MRRTAPLLALILALAAPAAAQDAVMPVIRAPWQNPRTSTPMRVQSLRVDVRVVGHLAITTWDVTVFNPQHTVLEGELVFPLGEGQTVSRFAMDVNGALREGVVVEKEKGRQAFDDVVRRGIDPGLLEKTAGNTFRARIYPIPAAGSKRIVVAYEQELKETGAGAAAGLVYRLPLAFTDKVQVFTVRAEVLDRTGAPVVQSSPLPGFAFTAWRRAFVAESTQRDVVPNAALALVLPRAEEGRGAFVAGESGHRYFYVTVTPRASRRPKARPERVLVVWDASASARFRDRTAELSLLDAYVRRVGHPEVSVAVFRNVMEPLQTGTWAEMRKVIETAPLDGATAFGSLTLADVRADEVVLVSDGLGTFGGGEPKLPPCPLVVVSSARTANPAWLRALAERTGGELIDLTAVSSAEAEQALTTQPLTFLGTTVDGTQIDEVYPSRRVVVRGTVGVAGRLKSSRARITLRFGFGASETVSRTFDLDASEAADAPVARIWAQKKLADLSADPVRHAATIASLGREFGIVTEGTSLIVLDRASDYARYRIEPPAELRAEYEQIVRQEAAVVAKTSKDHLERVVAQFEERKTWWRTEFKPGPAIAKQTQEVVAGATAEANRVAADAVAAPGAPSPAPAAMALRSAGRAASAAPVSGAGSPASEPTAEGTIDLKAWSPDTPYMRELRAADAGRRYAVYLGLRETWGDTPGFYLDVADVFRDQGEPGLALRILTNLAELKADDPGLLRVLGYRLRQLRLVGQAVWTFEEVLRLRSDEPQSHRDLALALADDGQTQRAVDLMWAVVTRPWDERFRDIDLIVAGEMNAVIATAKARPDTSRIDPRLVASLPVDIRAVLNWDTPNSDMDLHVIDPRGEECFFSHQRTEIGGRISADVTTGFGPEEFLLRRAIPGEYTVRAKFFGTRQQTAVGATTVVLELYLRYGTGQVENKSITLRLDGAGRMVDVGTFTVR
jgi:hypothetical protein